MLMMLSSFLNFLVLLSLAFLSVSRVCVVCAVFDVSSFRTQILALITAEVEGITLTNNVDLLHPLDLLKPGGFPLGASLLRLVFTDCAGFSSIYRRRKSICDGCINLAEGSSAGLEIGSIRAIEDVCNAFAADISLADCWMLSATFALEHAAIVGQQESAAFGFHFDLGIEPGDIPYYIGREDCANAPDNERNLINTFPDPVHGWEEESKFLQKRFGFNNKEIVALVGGGHTLGRAHLHISGFAGTWDIFPGGLANLFFSSVLNESPIDTQVGFNLDWHQKPDIYNPEFSGDASIDQSLVQPQFIVTFTPQQVIDHSLPAQEVRLMLNSDIALAYDLSSYIKHGQEGHIDCHTDAASVCGGQTVRTAGYEPHGFDANGVDYCPIKQCPFQCPGGEDGFNALLAAGLENLNEHSQCTIGFVKLFADDIAHFYEVFIQVFTKMITTGYRNKKGAVFLEIAE